MYRFFFNRVKRLLPKISDTELIALRSGTTHIDREIFSGKVDKNRLLQDVPAKSQLSDLEKGTDKFLKEIGQKNLYPSKDFNRILKIIGKKGYFSMIIDKCYNGTSLSYQAQASLLSKISAYNPSLGVVVMVPNSLGPAELLQNYGSNEQKSQYLKGLADGTYIPCFGLTGPHNGSDAIGEIDRGIVKMHNGKKIIEIGLDKRYITLAPVSNLIGIAFQLHDPYKLLQTGKEGITLALVEKGHEGLIQNTFHNPNHAGFPNGTLKGKIRIGVDSIIGGEKNAGEGWKMLMECLTVGRGISLPSSSVGMSKLITFGIFHYIQNRNQFRMPIGEMEGIQEKFVEMYIDTFINQAGLSYTSHILDQGCRPSVITAIMKQQTTERARKVLHHGMDIYAGSGICIGENNFLTPFYQSAPIGITVEGSNTLTRSLIIFGQGINKSHPYIFDIMNAIQTNDLAKFKVFFDFMIRHTISNYMKSCFSFRKKRLDLLVIRFANLTNFVALLGGKIKSNQMISGCMADALSNIYLCYAIEWYTHYYHFEKKKFLHEKIIEKLCQDAEEKLNRVIDNYPIWWLKYVLLPTRTKPKPSIDFNDVRIIYNDIKSHPAFIEILKKDLYYEGTIIEKLESLTKLDPRSKEYEETYRQILGVGEFEIEH